MINEMKIRLKLICLVASSVLCDLPVIAQYYNQQHDFLNANGVWSISNMAGWDFNRQYPGPVQTQLVTNGGHASVADPLTGELLFYSNGGQCWNKYHQVMPNGNGLLGASIAFAGDIQYRGCQGVCIIPVIGEPQKYYLFSLRDANPSLGFYPGPEGTLFYSIVDMNLDNGRGDIVADKKNVLVTRDSLGNGMIAIPGDHCDEIWLLLNKINMLQFRAYRIHRSGLDTIPVISTLGGPAWANEAYAFTSWGGLAVSPARDKIVLTDHDVNGSSFTHLGGAVLCRFDPKTGIVNDPIDVPGVNSLSVCGAFSPDNSKLYLISSGFNQPERLLQYDVTLHTNAALGISRTVVHELEDRSLYLAYLRQYKGKIYVSRKCEANVSVQLGLINNPNLSGSACDFRPKGLDLVATCWNLHSNQKVLPNEVVFPLKRDTIYRQVMDSFICTTDNNFRPLTLSAPSGKKIYHWDDGSINADRKIVMPGIYSVTYQLEDCNWQVDSFKIRHVDLSFSLGKDTTAILCDRPGAGLKLEANLPGAVYRWQDGSSDHRYQVVRSGKYWVEVNKDGCTASDTIVIKNITPELSDTLLCREEKIDITLKAPEVPARTMIEWSTGTINQTSIRIADPGLYWVKIINPPCILSDSMHVNVEMCDCKISMPDAFSPNEDGINDIFRPVLEDGCLVRSYSLVIYNRYGELIFNSGSFDKGWDGSYDGMPAGIETYFYVIQFNGGSSPKGTEYNKKGSLVLVR